MAFTVKYEISTLEALYQFKDAISRIPGVEHLGIEETEIDGECDEPECQDCKDLQEEAENDAT